MSEEKFDVEGFQKLKAALTSTKRSKKSVSETLA